jgi:hypothetical protein
MPHHVRQKGINPDDRPSQSGHVMSQRTHVGPTDEGQVSWEGISSGWPLDHENERRNRGCYTVTVQMV